MKTCFYLNFSLSTSCIDKIQALFITMWFDEMGEIFEMFRGSFPLSFLFFVPIFIIISPVSPVNAAQEFGVYRMQHYDLQGTSYGNS